jgi:aryl carrier-like protein
VEFSSSPDADGNSIEKQIVSLYSEMLHQSDIKETDNFLHLGGHSLTAAKLLARVRAIFGVNVSLRNFFADPTPAGLATAMRTARTGTEVLPGARTARRMPLDALDPE